MHPSGGRVHRGETVNWLLIAILGYVLVQFAIDAALREAHVELHL